MTKRGAVKRSSSDRPKGIGLCLGGGGARGYFHVGVVKALRELQVPVSEISGCSIGAVIGGILAADPECDFNKITKDFKFVRLVKLQARSRGFIDMDRVRQYLESLIPAKKFKDLKIPLSVNATDMHKAKEVVFRRGPIVPAIMKSISIPGIFPIKYESGKALCDGGFLNMVPASNLSSRRIIISDLTPPLADKGKAPTHADILKAAVYIPLKHQVDTMLDGLSRDKRKKFVHLHLDSKMEILDFRSRQTQNVMKQGYDQTMAKKVLIRRLMR